MSFAVAWNPLATKQIDRWWSNAGEFARKSMLQALEQVESCLREIPLEVGESREQLNERILIIQPIAVRFRVDVGRLRVRVLSVQVSSASG